MILCRRKKRPNPTGRAMRDLTLSRRVMVRRVYCSMLVFMRIADDRCSLTRLLWSAAVAALRACAAATRSSRRASIWSNERKTRVRRWRVPDGTCGSGVWRYPGRAMCEGPIHAIDGGATISNPSNSGGNGA